MLVVDYLVFSLFCVSMWFSFLFFSLFRDTEEEVECEISPLISYSGEVRKLCWVFVSRVCVCARTHTHTHTPSYTPIHTHTHTQTLLHTHTHTHTHTQTLLHTHTPHKPFTYNMSCDLHSVHMCPTCYLYYCMLCV